MTNLERLIQAHTQAATLTTLSTATAKLAEEMAREALKDPALRATIHAIVQTHFAATVARLAQQAPMNGRRKRASRARREHRQSRAKPATRKAPR